MIFGFCDQLNYSQWFTFVMPIPASFMRYFVFLHPVSILILLLIMSFTAISPVFPVYTGNDLGVTWSGTSTTFKVWAPEASAVTLRLYESGTALPAIKTLELSRADSGTWAAVLTGDYKNKYYTFQTEIDGKLSRECPDIYARAVGVNGSRGMVVNLKGTDPAGWAADKKPAQHNFTDIILYELHLRDISVSPASGIAAKGKFLGLAEAGTRNAVGQSTGLDHLRELGVTHVHLMPAFDFNSVDETLSIPQYNWGYDPQNFNVPEGSYSTNPYDGNIRIREFKQLVQTLHKNGLRVILDVVYNHTSNIEGSNFTQFAPGYFYRHLADGNYSNGTGCGNETASDAPMMRKFMIESVCYWAREYHIDGFRFDLMGVHDIKTMNEISAALHKIDPTIFIYGEGWDAGQTPLPAAQRALKKNVAQLNQVAAFSDDIRDGLRGVNPQTKGFVSGQPGTAETIRFGIVAATRNPQVHYNGISSPWATEPGQAISYASCHDDNTLFDRLKRANPEATETALIQMDKLTAAIVLTSQGVPFLMAGEEFIRSKRGIENSYNSPDSINEIDWTRKSTYASVFHYYQGLIALRKAHPAFRLPSADMIRKNLEFLPDQDSLTVSYLLKNHAGGDRWKTILVLLNGNGEARRLTLPRGNWTVVADEDTVKESGLRQVKDTLLVPGTAAYILVQEQTGRW